MNTLLRIIGAVAIIVGAGGALFAAGSVVSDIQIQLAVAFSNMALIGLGLIGIAARKPS